MPSCNYLFAQTVSSISQRRSITTANLCLIIAYGKSQHYDYNKQTAPATSNKLAKPATTNSMLGQDEAHQLD